MKDSHKDTLLRLAYENSGTKGRFKLAAGIIYRGRIICTGVNSYKTHPIMCNDHYREEQMSLHAEAAALVKASRMMLPAALSEAHLCVVRVSRGLPPSGEAHGPVWLLNQGYRESLAKPCKGCFALIREFGIKEVHWTID